MMTTDIETQIEMENQYENEIDCKWMEADMLEYKENKEEYDKLKTEVFSTPMPQKIVLLKDEDYSKNMGYLIEQKGSAPEVYTTFWVFNADGELQEKKVFYNSLYHLYEESKIFVKSPLITYSLLHESKYKMLCDFIPYYEK